MSIQRRAAGSKSSKLILTRIYAITPRPHSLSNLLEQLLLDSRWSSNMEEYATQKAQSMENLNLDDLVAAVQAKGSSG